jgi:TnpA family transposase
MPCHHKLETYLDAYIQAAGILDYLVVNDSDVRPDTIHADTQGQSAAILGLAHLLGIQLQPRIRNGKGLHFYRSKPALQYERIDLLFSPH